MAEARRLGARNARLAPVAAPVLGKATVPRCALRSDLGVTERDVMIVTVGRLAPQKNLGLVLEIARSVRDHRELWFLIAGEGPLRDELADRATADGSNVILLGHYDDIASLLGAADPARCSPRRGEARALAAQEALLSGVPLVSTWPVASRSWWMTRRCCSTRTMSGKLSTTVGPGTMPIAERRCVPPDWPAPLPGRMRTRWSTCR